MALRIKDPIVDLSPTEHEWEEVSANISWGGFPRRAFECKHCYQIRVEDEPLRNAIALWGGAHAIWNGQQFCGVVALEEARQGDERCAIGVGIETLAAFLGSRSVGYLYRDGRIPYRTPPGENV